MAKKLEPKSLFGPVTVKRLIDPNKVSIPSDVLLECDKLYANFKKCYDKYAPGKLAFFKFNSTIADNLDNLKSKGCPNLCKIGIYRSYFRDCKGIDSINKNVAKICEKLGSLLKSIGESDDASISTLGIKGIFSKKRTEDDRLSDSYKYFSSVKENITSTVKDNKFIPNDDLYSGLNFGVLEHESSSYASVSDLSTTIFNITDDENDNTAAKKALLEKLKAVELKFFLKLSNILDCTNGIPSYAEIISEFLNNSKKAYNNLYGIQHKFKQIYDIKGKENKNDSEETEKLKTKYNNYATEMKRYKEDLESSIAYLEQSTQKFNKNWKKDTRKATKNIIAVGEDMNALFTKIKNANKDIKSQRFIKKADVIDPTSYSQMTSNLSSSMKITVKNISVLEKQVLGNGQYIVAMKYPLSLSVNFETIKSDITEYINNFEVKDIAKNPNDKVDFINALNAYIASFQEIQTEYNKILTNVTKLHSVDVQNLINDINKKEEQEHFDKVKKKVRVAATVAGTSISILSALMTLFKKV